MDIMNILHFCIKKGLSCDMVESILCLQTQRLMIALDILWFFKQQPEVWIQQRSIIDHGYETRSFDLTCLGCRSGKELLRETGISLGYRLRCQRGVPCGMLETI
jgi:hypothetical protein